MLRIFSVGWRIALLGLVLAGVQTVVAFSGQIAVDGKRRPVVAPKVQLPETELLNGTYLGTAQRNYYGDSIGDSLRLIWRAWLGKGKTVVTSAKGVEEWYGAGWTGQPLLVREGNRRFLLQGCFDHQLKKLDAATGALCWTYAFDDILKGTGTLWIDRAADSLNRYLILQGSRVGVHDSGVAVGYSYRAISYGTGLERWRLFMPPTASYSRDVDASALVRADTAYIGLENGYFAEFFPGQTVADTVLGQPIRQPVVRTRLPLFDARDVVRHGGNLVTEASPVQLGDHLYIAAGSGHVYGYNLNTRQLDWDVYIGADLDGTPTVTADSCLLVPVEKQYIAGKGGVLKLNPRRAPEQCIDWFYPTGDAEFSGWKGGVVGSVAVNDAYSRPGDLHLAAFTGIDGWLTVLRWDAVRTDTLVTGPDGQTQLPCPQVVARVHTGPSISTPLFTRNRLVAASYSGIRLFALDAAGQLTLLDQLAGSFEATPLADAGRIYCASRDGYLYCLGGGAAQPMPALLLAQEEKKMPKKLAVVPQPIAENAKPQAPAKLPLPVRVKTPLPVAADVPPVAAPLNAPEGKWQLVAGVFRSRTNAARNHALWCSRGFAASLVQRKNGMYYTVLATATTAAPLKAQLPELHRSFGVDVWVMEQE